jgi:nucleotide-binding universal stress UspA family protein
MKKILLPTDFSKASERAIHYALAMFDDTACEFTLLNTYTTNTEPEIAMYVLDDLKKNAENLMASFLKGLKHFDTASYHTFKTEYMPVSAGSAIEILNQTNQYDLVVLGASGAGNNLFFGSVATDVVRNVTTNTLVSSGTERMLVEFGKASWIEKARQQPDKVRMVLEKIKTDGLMPKIDVVRNKLDQPLPLGYCNVGVVLETGTTILGKLAEISQLAAHF